MEEVVLNFLMYYLSICLKGLRKIMKNIRQDC